MSKMHTKRSAFRWAISELEGNDDLESKISELAKKIPQ